jgi:DNA-binding response OmpR family regulator
VPRILSISRNPRSLTMRDETLALAGYTVASPREPDGAVLLLSQRSFDAVVVADSVNLEVRQVLIAAIRKRWPQTPIFFVFAGPEKSQEPLADVRVDVSSGPMPLFY